MQDILRNGYSLVQPVTLLVGAIFAALAAHRVLFGLLNRRTERRSGLLLKSIIRHWRFRPHNFRRRRWFRLSGPWDWGSSERSAGLRSSAAR